MGNSLKEENILLTENFNEYKTKTNIKLEQLMKQNDLLQSQLNLILKSNALGEKLRSKDRGDQGRELEQEQCSTETICKKIEELQKSFEIDLKSPKTPICTGTTASTQVE